MINKMTVAQGRRSEPHLFFFQRLENALYSTGLPKAEVRKVPMRVLCVGLSRSATESLQQALEILGVYPTYHGWGVLEPGAYEYWVKTYRKRYSSNPSQCRGESSLTREHFELMLAGSQAVTDFCAAHFADDIIRAYPEAMVILNTRKDIDAWYESIMSTFYAIRPTGFAWVRNFFNARLYWRNCFYAETVFGFYNGNMPATAKWRAREHVASVRGSVEPSRLLEWSVEDGWQPLCEFLHVPVPSKPFPNGNRPADFHSKANRSNQRAVLKGNVNLGLFCLVLLLFLGWTLRMYQ
jgi:hypothetical protein